MLNFTWGIKNNFSLHSILFCSTSGFSNRLVSFGMFGRTVLADTCPGSMPLPIKPKRVMHSSRQFWSANYNKRRQITQLRNQLLQFSYSRLWNKHKGIFINFWQKIWKKNWRMTTMPWLMWREATFIQGGKSIPEYRVGLVHNYTKVFH